MAEFKPMIKMETDEPSVILKLKKGGHVSSKGHKEEHGHRSMTHMAMGGPMPPMPPKMGGNAMARVMGARRPMVGAGMAPRKPMIPPPPAPQMGGAMPAPQMNAPAMRKGGKVHHKAKGGHMESASEERSEKRELNSLKRELKHHEHEKASKAHHGLKHGGKVHHKAKGGSMDLGGEEDRYESRDAIKGNEGKFLQTKMVGASADRASGTKGIKEANAGGYKHGGKVHRVSGHPEGSAEHHKHMAKHHMSMHKEGGSAHHRKMHEHHKEMAKLCGGGSMKKYAVGGTVSDSVAKKFENTMVMSADRRDTASGTKGIKESNAGGYKHGGKVHHKYAKGGAVENSPSMHSEWENRPASGTPAGKTNGTTGSVKEANAGGYKHGGKVHKYAKGGMVDSGRAEKMPRKAPSEPVSITKLSGTFKKGGHVRF